MKRIFLFLATNMAIIAVASITLSLLGVGNYIKADGGLDLQSLLAFCAVFGMAGALVSLLISKPMAKWSTKTVIIEQPNSDIERWLLTTVKSLADKANIGMPDVGVFPAQQSNAFATGWNKNKALVAVSAGLLHRFDKGEVEAVLAHEIGHVANGDMVTLALIQGVVNTFVMFFARIIGYVIDRAVLKNENGHGIGFYIATFVAEIILGFLASTIVMWFSRQREFRADTMGAQLSSNQAMIGALQRLKAESEVPDQMPDSLTAFGITEGLKQGLAAMFRSHPPLDERIDALRAQH